MQSRIQPAFNRFPRRNDMQPRNSLIHVVVASAALHAAALSTPASAVMPVPEYAALTCEPRAEACAAYPGPYVAYPEGEVVFQLPASVVGD
jgi:hypothetical protein